MLVKLRLYFMCILFLLITGGGVSANPSPYFCLDILTVNSFNGSLLETVNNPGAAKLSQMLKQEQAKNPEGTLILAAGNMFAGSAVSNLSFGSSVVSFMNEAGFAAMCLGNHEIEWPLSVLKERQKEAKFPFLISNIISLDTKEKLDIGTSYTIVERGPVKIGIIGVTKPELNEQKNLLNGQRLSFYDPAVIVKMLVPELKRRGADVIVVLSNLPASQNADGKIGGSAANLAKDNANINLIVADNGELVTAGKVGRVSIVQAGSDGRFVGQVRMVYSLKERKIAAAHEQVIKVESDKLTVDEAAQKIVKKAIKNVDPLRGLVLGTTNRQLVHNKTELSPLGMWAADIIKEHCKVQIVLLNGGAINNHLEKGKITLGELHDIFSFNDTIGTVFLQGEQIKKILERSLNDKAFAGLQYTGLNVTLVATPSGNRLKKVVLTNGEVMDDIGWYEVAIDGALLSSYGVCDSFQDIHYANLQLREIIKEYIQSHGTVQPNPFPRLFIEAK